MNYPLTLWTTFRGLATKQLTYNEEKNCLEKSKRPELSTGIGRVINVSLPDLPEVLETLTPQQCVATGVPVEPEFEHFEFYTKRRMMSRFGVTAFQDITGKYLARTADNFHHPETRLFVFDHDPSPDDPVELGTPEKFMEFISALAPEFEGLAYVTKHSSSANVSYQGRPLTGSGGYHVYFGVTAKISNTEIMQRLEYRAWREGFGYITLNAIGSMLTRVPWDMSVGQTNRIMYEAPAILQTQGLEQNNPARYVAGKDLADLTHWRPLNAQEQLEMEQCQAKAKQAPAVLKRVAKIRDKALVDLQQRYLYSPKQAEMALQSQLAGVLSTDHELQFDGGEMCTVLELLMYPDRYDGRTLADPLEPHKGPGKAQFYSNGLDNNPVIHTFVRHGGVYRLSDSLVAKQHIDDADPVNAFKRNPNQIHTLEVNLQYLGGLELPDTRLVMMRSEKGTGKTQLIKDWRDQGKLGRVLAVAPLIALVKDASNRLDLVPYDDKQVKQGLSGGFRGVATTLDSLKKFALYPVDTLVLDEFEKLIKRLVSSSLGQRRQVQTALRKLAHRAKRIILADADLSSATISLLQELHILPEAPGTVIINNYQPSQSGVLHLMDTEAGWKTEIARVLAENPKDGAYIAMNKRGGVHHLVHYLLEKLPRKEGEGYKHGEFMIPLEDGRRIIVVTKDNSSTEAVKTFVANINKRLKKTDIFISSPSLSSGVSINAVDDLPKFRYRFMAVTPLVGATSEDAVQHLERVRQGHKCETYLYCQVVRMALSTDENLIIEQDIFGKHLECLRMGGNIFDPNKVMPGAQEIDIQTDRAYNVLYGYIKSQSNFDRNHYRANLIQRLTKQGYRLVDYAERITKKDKKDLKNARINQREYLQHLRVTAPLIDEAAYNLLKNKTVCTPEDEAAMEKYEFALCTGLHERSVELQTYFTDKYKPSHRRCICDGLLLGVNPRRLAQLDIIHATQTARMVQDHTALYPRYQLIMEIINMFGISLGTSQHIPVCDVRQFWPADVPEMYDQLRALDRDPNRPGYSRFKTLLNINLIDTKEVREQSKVIAHLLRKSGVRLGRVSVRDAKTGQPTHYREIDLEWMNMIKERILWARVYSRHEYFVAKLPVSPRLQQFSYELHKNGLEKMKPHPVYQQIAHLGQIYIDELMALLNSDLYDWLGSGNQDVA